jgi:hypothetical protein
VRVHVSRGISAVLLASLAACSGGGSDGEVGDASDSAAGDVAPGDAEVGSDARDASNDGDTGAIADADATKPPTITTSVITTEHRFIAGSSGMFGGWGPHLGHLLRRATPDELWFADDACAQAGTVDVCDVSVDRRVDYWRLGDAGWTKIDAQSLPSGVQQNTASVLRGDTVHSFGVDTSGGALVECTFDLGSHAKSCVSLALAVGASANYVGAALTPKGEKVAWLTDVKDGGGGGFSWYVDYGGGWNGPRAGDAAGYNDAAYVHAAFDGDEMILHAQFVSGTAPAWSFFAGVGTTKVSTSDTVAWVMALAAPSGDSIVSTDDVVVDAASGDAHLVARSEKGAAVYYHRPSGGAWSAPLFVTEPAYRARLVLTSDGTLHLAYGPNGKGLALRSAPSSSRVAGMPVDWTSFPEQPIALPAGYESIDAIYPQTSIYQTAPVEGLRIAVVGAARQNEVLFVAIDP